MLDMQPAVAGLSVMDFNLCVYVFMCSFCFAFCVYPILFVYFLFFNLSEVLMNKDVHISRTFRGEKYGGDRGADLTGWGSGGTASPKYEGLGACPL